MFLIGVPSLFICQYGNRVPCSDHYNSCPGSFTGIDWVNCAAINSSISVHVFKLFWTHSWPRSKLSYILRMFWNKAVLLKADLKKLSQVLKLSGKSLLMIVSCSRTAVWCSQAALSPPDSSSRTFNPRGVRVLGTQLQQKNLIFQVWIGPKPYCTLTMSTHIFYLVRNVRIKELKNNISKDTKRKIF